MRSRENQNDRIRLLSRARTALIPGSRVSLPEIRAASGLRSGIGASNASCTKKGNCEQKPPTAISLPAKRGLRAFRGDPASGNMGTPDS